MQQIPPLPVTVILCWKAAEQGSRWFAQNAEGMRALATGPFGVPEYGRHAGLYFLAFTGFDLSIEEQQYSSAVLQLLLYLWCECCCYDQMGGCCGVHLILVYPEVPIVHTQFAYAYFQVQFFRRFYTGEIERDVACRVICTEIEIRLQGTTG